MRYHTRVWWWGVDDQRPHSCVDEWWGITLRVWWCGVDEGCPHSCVDGLQWCRDTPGYGVGDRCASYCEDVQVDVTLPAWRRNGGVASWTCERYHIDWMISVAWWLSSFGDDVEIFNLRTLVPYRSPSPQYKGVILFAPNWWVTMYSYSCCLNWDLHVLGLILACVDLHLYTLLPHGYSPWKSSS